MKPLSDRLLAMAASNMWSMQEVSDLLEEAAALAKSVESAPVRTVIHQHIKGQEWEALAFELDDFLPGLVGRRVRIVAETEGS